MITKDELAAMIAALESQPHLSIKEEKYLKVCRQLFSYMSDCHHVWVRNTGGFKCEHCGDEWGKTFS